jgi:hypothetical protein
MPKSVSNALAPTNQSEIARRKSQIISELAALTGESHEEMRVWVETCVATLSASRDSSGACRRRTGRAAASLQLNKLFTQIMACRSAAELAAVIGKRDAFAA